MTPGDEMRKDATRTLIRIAVFEAAMLAAVVGVFLFTNNFTYLIGGIVGAQIVAIPMFLGWARENSAALKSKE